jgi:hypothetical protein
MNLARLLTGRTQLEHLHLPGTLIELDSVLSCLAYLSPDLKLVPKNLKSFSCLQLASVMSFPNMLQQGQGIAAIWQDDARTIYPISGGRDFQLYSYLPIFLNRMVLVNHFADDEEKNALDILLSAQPSWGAHVNEMIQMSPTFASRHELGSYEPEEDPEIRNLQRSSANAYDAWFGLFPNLELLNVEEFTGEPVDPTGISARFLAAAVAIHQRKLRNVSLPLNQLDMGSLVQHVGWYQLLRNNTATLESLTLVSRGYAQDETSAEILISTSLPKLVHLAFITHKNRFPTGDETAVSTDYFVTISNNFPQLQSLCFQNWFIKSWTPISAAPESQFRQMKLDFTGGQQKLKEAKTSAIEGRLPLNPSACKQLRLLDLQGCDLLHATDVIQLVETNCDPKVLCEIRWSIPARIKQGLSILNWPWPKLPSDAAERSHHAAVFKHLTDARAQNNVDNFWRTAHICQFAMYMSQRHPRIRLSIPLHTVWPTEMMTVYTVLTLDGSNEDIFDNDTAWILFNLWKDLAYRMPEFGMQYISEKGYVKSHQDLVQLVLALVKYDMTRPRPDDLTPEYEFAMSQVFDVEKTLEMDAEETE